MVVVCLAIWCGTFLFLTFGVACRAGALVFVVAFWFDGGLFTLATGSVFWVLLELGNVNHECTRINTNH
jgi:hypothetical protein